MLSSALNDLRNFSFSGIHSNQNIYTIIISTSLLLITFGRNLNMNIEVSTGHNLIMLINKDVVNEGIGGRPSS